MITNNNNHTKSYIFIENVLNSEKNINKAPNKISVKSTFINLIALIPYSLHERVYDAILTYMKI